MAIANGSTGSATEILLEHNSTGTHKSNVGVPPLGIIYLNDVVANMPTGFTELTAARGFMIVGLPSGGTKAGTVGTAFTNVQNKALAAHFHSGPSHDHANGGTGTAGSGGGNFNAWNADLSAGKTAAGGTGNTGNGGAVNTSDILAYIQYPAIVKT